MRVSASDRPASHQYASDEARTFNYGRIQRNPAFIAYSPQHDGQCGVDHKVTFHEGSNEANPSFARHRVSWRDDVGCLHWARYDVLIEPPSDQGRVQASRQHTDDGQSTLANEDDEEVI